MIEYKTINVTLYLDDKALNELGAQGWELAHIIPDPEGDVFVRYIFMRDRNWIENQVRAQMEQAAGKAGGLVS